MLCIYIRLLLTNIGTIQAIFVFILFHTCLKNWWFYLNNVCIGPALVRLIVLCVFEQDFVHVSAGILEQLVCMVEDDQSDLAVTQHTQLVGFLHQAKLSLCERHLTQNSREMLESRGWEQTKPCVSFCSVDLNNLSWQEYFHTPLIKTLLMLLLR